MTEVSRESSLCILQMARCVSLSLRQALVLNGGKTWVAINLIDDLELGLGGFKGDYIPKNRSISWREILNISWSFCLARRSNVPALTLLTRS